VERQIETPLREREQQRQRDSAKGADRAENRGVPAWVARQPDPRPPSPLLGRRGACRSGRGRSRGASGGGVPARRVRRGASALRGPVSSGARRLPNAPLPGDPAMSDVSGRPEPDPAAEVDHVRDAYARLKAEIAKVVVGQEEVVDEILTAIFSQGHALVVGVPGLAKTLLISTIARTLNLAF